MGLAREAAMTIESAEEYYVVGRRVRALADFPEGTGEAQEMANLIAALRDLESLMANKDAAGGAVSQASK